MREWSQYNTALSFLTSVSWWKYLLKGNSWMKFPIFITHLFSHVLSLYLLILQFFQKLRSVISSEYLVWFFLFSKDQTIKINRNMLQELVHRAKIDIFKIEFNTCVLFTFLNAFLINCSTKVFGLTVNEI